MISVPDEKFQLKARCRAAIKIHENLSQASEMHLSSLTKGKRLGLSECFLYQAIIDLIRKDVKKAIRTFEKAVSIENNIDFFYVFAISLKLGHHYELAEPYLKKCCENDPSNRNFLTEYIHTLHKLKKWSLANKIHQELHSL